MTSIIQSLLRNLNKELENLKPGETVHVTFCTNNRETYTIPLTKDVQITSLVIEESKKTSLPLTDEPFS